MNNIKISIIVPVYNVEQYLIRCIESLIHQTYQNFEIILVDDGSTDGSGNICNQYGKQYEFIRVFHKENGGLSSARNYALPYVTSDFLTFVDSDDYVDNCYLEILVKAFLQFKEVEPKIIISSHIDEMHDGKIIYKKKYEGLPILLGTADALSELCYEKKFGTSACGKLYKTDLFSVNRFREGKLYEDLFLIPQLIGETEKIVFVDVPTYHYVQRPGSIRGTWTLQTFDVMEAAENLLAYISKNQPDILHSAIYRLFFSANEVYVRAFDEENYLTIIAPIIRKLKPFWENIRKNSQISKFQMVRYWMMINTPNIYRWIWKIYKRGKHI